MTVRRVRVRGGNFKFRALRLDTGNFSWGSEVGLPCMHHAAKDSNCAGQGATQGAIHYLVQSVRELEVWRNRDKVLQSMDPMHSAAAISAQREVLLNCSIVRGQTTLCKKAFHRKMYRSQIEISETRCELL